MPNMLIRLTHALLLISLLGLPIASQAVYRCVDEAGNTTFSQQPCAPGQASDRVTLEIDVDEADIDPAVCEEIRKLAELIFPHIHTEESILTMYNKLGGRGSLSAGVTSAVNYVYNFRYNPEAKQALVVRLTHEKCLERGFGVIKQGDLPDWNHIAYQPQEKTNGADTAAKPASANSNCEKYREAIDTLEAKIKNAQSKSDELRLQSDKEHMQHLLRENCGKR